MNHPQTASVRERVSAEEWEARVDLAACYRFAAHFRMTDLIYTHISARVPGPEHHFLLNAFGLMWDEVKASNLVKITLDGEIVDDPTGLGFNQAGFVIHSAIHAARPEVMCVMHTHTAAGIGVSAQEQGLLPISQHAAFSQTPLISTLLRVGSLLSAPLSRFTARCGDAERDHSKHRAGARRRPLCRRLFGPSAGPWTA